MHRGVAGAGGSFRSVRAWSFDTCLAGWVDEMWVAADEMYPVQSS